MMLHGKTALITGGNSGIGLATAKLMIARGARVVITGRDSATLNAAVANLGQAAVGYQIELTDGAALPRLADFIKEEFGHLDILFPNAGVSGPTPIGSTTVESFSIIVNTNLTAVFFTVQSLAPLLVDGGCVVLIGSIQRELGRPGAAAYAASKAGISSMARVFASEFASRGIRVNTVIPGATRTPILTRGPLVGNSLAASEALFAPRIPLAKMCEPEDIAEAVGFLASSAASCMTAAEIVVDGGSIGAFYGAPIFRSPR